MFINSTGRHRKSSGVPNSISGKNYMYDDFGKLNSMAYKLADIHLAA